MKTTVDKTPRTQK